MRLVVSHHSVVDYFLITAPQRFVNDYNFEFINEPVMLLIHLLSLPLEYEDLPYKSLWMSYYYRNDNILEGAHYYKSLIWITIMTIGRPAVKEN